MLTFLNDDPDSDLPRKDSLPESHSSITEASSSSTFSWPVFLRLSAGHLFADLYAGFMLPLLPLLSTKLHFDLGATGLLLFFSSLSSSVIQPWLGLMCDRVKGINFAVIGVLLACVFIGLIGWVDSFWALVAVILLGYLGVGLFHPQATTWVNAMHHPKRNFTMGTFISIGTLGFALGPFLSSYLVEQGGLGATVWGIIPGVLGAVLLMGTNPVKRTDRLFPETHQSEPHQGVLNIPINVSKSTIQLSESSSPASPLEMQPVSSQPDPSQLDPSLPWRPSEKRLLFLLSLIGIARAILLVGLPTYMPFLWTEKGFSLVTIGTVIGLGSVAGCPSGILGGYLGDKWGEKKVLFASFLPVLVLLPLIFQTQGWLSFGMFILVIGCLEGSLGTSLVLALRGTQKNPNMVSGLVGGFSWGVAGLLMPLIGYLAEQYGIQAVALGLLIPVLVALGCIPFLSTGSKVSKTC
ncbi:MAG: MFS transporter [Cyanobacteria bacterium]|nr:MFS transporter [Cyanobacteriota bacterium]